MYKLLKTFAEPAEAEAEPSPILRMGCARLGGGAPARSIWSPARMTNPKERGVNPR